MCTGNCFSERYKWVRFAVHLLRFLMVCLLFLSNILQYVYGTMYTWYTILCIFTDLPIPTPDGYRRVSCYVGHDHHLYKETYQLVTWCNNRWLPLHWALSRDRPHTEILFLLVSAYPEGLFDHDYQDQLPYDKYEQAFITPCVCLLCSLTVIVPD